MKALKLSFIPLFLLTCASGYGQSPDNSQGPHHAGMTDRGSIRPQNEDSFFVQPEKGFYVVADGMGGHAAGEVASGIAVATAKEFSDTPIWDALNDIWPMVKISLATASYHEANRRILKDSLSNPAHRGMGTTMVSALVRKDSVEIINVGDSRAYRIRGNHMVQISHDQSLVQKYIDEGILKTPEEIAAFPYKNVITQAMGTQPEIIPDIFSEPRRAGDIYLLCSDGLVNELADDEILKIVTDNSPDWTKTAQTLIDKAKAAGGHDNITVVLIQITD